MRVTPNHFIIMFVEFSHMEKKDFPRVTLVFEDGKWVGAHKMILAASSCLCAAAWQKKASAPTDLYEGNSEQYFGGIWPAGIMLNARNLRATFCTSREMWAMAKKSIPGFSLSIPSCLWNLTVWFLWHCHLFSSGFVIINWLYLFDFSPLCVFKCVFK